MLSASLQAGMISESLGQVCGAGGRAPTVTDANLVLGRLRAQAFLGGAMRLDEAAARSALQPLAQGMGLTVEEAALGIVRVADEHMARALRVISVQKGIDPRDFTLVSFGGAGGLHVCALAEALGMCQAMVPVHAGVLSALGMLAAPPGRNLSLTCQGALAEFDAAAIDAALTELVEQGRAMLAEEGLSAEQVYAAYSLDLRYRGQSYTLNVPWQGRDGSAAAFHALHRSRYGHHLEMPVELLNLRVRVWGERPRPVLSHEEAPAGTRPFETAKLYGIEGAVPVLSRNRLWRAEVIAGPAVITETVATTWLAPGWRCRRDAVGNLMLEF